MKNTTNKNTKQNIKNKLRITKFLKKREKTDNKNTKQILNEI